MREYLIESWSYVFLLHVDTERNFCVLKDDGSA